MAVIIKQKKCHFCLYTVIMYYNFKILRKLKIIFLSTTVE